MSLEKDLKKYSYFMFNKEDPELTIKAMQRALIGTSGS